MPRNTRRKNTDRPLTAVALFSGWRWSRSRISSRRLLDSVCTGTATPIVGRATDETSPGVPFDAVEIEKVPDSQFRKVRRDAGGEVSVLFGGPPCPPYSKSRFYRKDKPRALADDLGEKTATGFLRALRLVRPNAFLMEKRARPCLQRSSRGPWFHCRYRRVSWLHVRNHSVECCEFWCSTDSRAVLLGRTQGRPSIHVSISYSPQFQAQPICSQFSCLLGRPAGDVILDLDTGDELPGHRAGGKHYELLRKVPPGDNYLFFTEERGHPEPQFRWRTRYWSFLLKLSPSLTIVDNSGTALQQYGPVSLEKQNSDHPGGQAAADISGRLVLGRDD